MILILNLNFPNLKGFRSFPTAYYETPFWFAYKQNNYCSYKKPTYLTQIEMINNFMNRMTEPQNIQTPYFALRFHNFYVHDHFSLPQNYDKLFANFLKKHESNLSGTMLIVMSDHGHRLVQYYQTNEGQKEHANPFLSIKVPKNLEHTQFYQNFESNRNK